MRHSDDVGGASDLGAEETCRGSGELQHALAAAGEDTAKRPDKGVCLVRGRLELALVQLQYRHKGFLGNLDVADSLHALFAFGLLLQ